MPDDQLRLTQKSVQAFVDAVASSTEPVPAGGSVAALSGACSAALLALVCGVLGRKDVAGMADLAGTAASLEQRLMVLVDEDAAAFRAFLDNRRDPPPATVARVTRAPLQVARACAEVVDLSRAIEERTHGPLLGDVRAARHLAGAALAAALDIADQDVSLFQAAESQQELRSAIAELRRSR